MIVMMSELLLDKWAEIILFSMVCLVIHFALLFRGHQSAESTFKRNPKVHNVETRGNSSSCNIGDEFI